MRMIDNLHRIIDSPIPHRRVTGRVASITVHLIETESFSFLSGMYKKTLPKPSNVLSAGRNLRFKSAIGSCQEALGRLFFWFAPASLLGSTR